MEKINTKEIVNLLDSLSNSDSDVSDLVLAPRKKKVRRLVISSLYNISQSIYYSNHLFFTYHCQQNIIIYHCDYPLEQLIDFALKLFQL